MDLESSQIVPRYVSDSDSDQIDQPQEKRQRRYIEYQTKQTFTNIREAKQFITNQQLWRYKSESKSFDGTKLIYLCKYSNNCSARICLWLPNKNFSIQLQVSKSDHDHGDRQMNGIF